MPRHRNPCLKRYNLHDRIYNHANLDIDLHCLHHSHLHDASGLHSSRHKRRPRNSSTSSFQPRRPRQLLFSHLHDCHIHPHRYNDSHAKGLRRPWLLSRRLSFRTRGILARPIRQCLEQSRCSRLRFVEPRRTRPSSVQWTAIGRREAIDCVLGGAGIWKLGAFDDR